MWSRPLIKIDGKDYSSANYAARYRKTINTLQKYIINISNKFKILLYSFMLAFDYI